MNMTVLSALISAVVAYLLGSISTSILVSKIMGATDIRKHGSGNAGATNTLRVLGKKAAVFVVLGDGLKGVVAVLFAWFFDSVLNVQTPMAEYVAAVFVMIGHVFPLYFGFKGGKGIMTSIAVILTLSPAIGGILFGIFVLLVLCFNYISLGSVVSAACFPVLVAIFYPGNTAFLVSSIIIALIAIIKHHTNISRLLKGTESKFIKKKE